MSIPDFQSIMLPLLKFASDKKEHTKQDSLDHISELFKLTEEEKKELLPSGKQRIISNRIGWARTYMSKAGLLESQRRGFFKITQRGLDVLAKNPSKINVKSLERFPEFVEFRTLKKEQKVNLLTTDLAKELEEVTPDELIEVGFNQINSALGEDLLDKLRTSEPSFFEQVVLQLLTGMGYGTGEVTGRSGDGGMDGFVNQDPLGLDKIFFQAKRFAETTPVSASMLRDFVGSLELRGVNKGVFITTSKFPPDAKTIITRTHKSIVLIDGLELVVLMIRHNIGVATNKTYEIKRIDSDFFQED